MLARYWGADAGIDVANVQFVRNLIIEQVVLAAKKRESPVFLPHGGTDFFARAAVLALRAHAARESNLQIGHILLKNSCLIEGCTADSIPVFDGRIGDDVTAAGSSTSAIL